MLSIFLWIVINLTGHLSFENELLSQAEFALSETSTFLHVCNQADTISSYELSEDTMPCNFLYPSSAVENNFLPKFNASYVESFTALTTTKARRCYKLSLRSHCSQKWLSPNEMWKDFEVFDVDRGACLGSSPCVGCNIADKYPAYDCRTWVFGDNVVSTIVVFAQEVIVHQNSLGQVFYGGLTTVEPVINIGGNLREKVFFDIVPTVVEKVGTFSINPSTLDLISYDMRRLLKSSKRNVTFQNEPYAVYDEDHLVNANSIYSMIAPPSLLKGSATTSTKSLTRTTGSTLGSTDISMTDYQAYFIQAQINVTNWYLNYLDCRLKRLALTTFKNAMISYLPAQTINNPAIVNMLDLGPGEYFKNNFIYKSTCLRVVIGSIVASGNCLRYLNGALSSNLSSSGELIQGTSCCKKLRINRTHIIQPNHDDTVLIAPQAFTSLLEEEDMLNYPPRVVSSFGYLRDLLLNSSLLNRIEGLNKSSEQSVTSSSFTAPSFIDWFMSTSIVKWTLASLLLLLLLAFMAVSIYFSIEWFKRPKTVHPLEQKGTLERDLPTPPEDNVTRYSFRLS